MVGFQINLDNKEDPGPFNSFSVGPFSTHDHLHLPHKAAGVALSSPKAVTVCEFVVQPQRLEEATDKRDFGEKAGLFEFGRPDRIVYNSSADGTLRSIEDSPKRLRDRPPGLCVDSRRLLRRLIIFGCS